MNSVANNPLLVMAINMFVVFAVLIMLGVLIQLTYYIDPTRQRVPKKVASEAPAAQAAAPAPTAVVPAKEDEVVAAITAAIVSLGYSASQIVSVRPQRSEAWISSARLAGRRGSRYQ